MLYEKLPRLNLRQNLGIVGIIVREEFAIFDGKTIAPERDMANCDILTFKTFVRDMSQNDEYVPRALGSGTNELGTSSLPSVLPLPPKTLDVAGGGARPPLLKEK
jgi:hypothetical protein